MHIHRPGLLFLEARSFFIHCLLHFYRHRFPHPCVTQSIPHLSSFLLHMLYFSFYFSICTLYTPLKYLYLSTPSISSSRSYLPFFSFFIAHVNPINSCYSLNSFSIVLTNILNSQVSIKNPCLRQHFTLK